MHKSGIPQSKIDVAIMTAVLEIYFQCSVLPVNAPSVQSSPTNCCAPKDNRPKTEGQSCRLSKVLDGIPRYSRHFTRAHVVSA
jgi:hypothetical protein